MLSARYKFKLRYFKWFSRRHSYTLLGMLRVERDDSEKALNPIRREGGRGIVKG